LRIEVHVHGDVPLRAGVTAAQVEAALRPLLEYIDEDSLADVRSVYEDEPGILYEAREHLLRICWSGDVGRKFGEKVQAALADLAPYTERAAGVSVSFYHDDGQDEFSMLFVGPTAESIHEAERLYLVEEMSRLLGRHFTEAEIGEVVTLVNQLFTRTRGTGTAGVSSSASLSASARKRLH
jgi:hypothetical protein